MFCSSGIVWTVLLQTQSIWHCYILLPVRGRDRAAGAGEDHLVCWQCFNRAKMMISTIALMLYQMFFCIGVQFVHSPRNHWLSVYSILDSLHWAHTNYIIKSFQHQIWTRFPFPMLNRFPALSLLNFFCRSFPSGFKWSSEGLWSPSGSF